MSMDAQVLSRSRPKLLSVGCPECGRRGRVYDCRSEKAGFRRSYECSNGHLWLTVEVRAERHRGMLLPTRNEDK